jgi:GTP cyclohydrolase I
MSKDASTFHRLLFQGTTTPNSAKPNQSSPLIVDHKNMAEIQKCSHSTLRASPRGYVSYVCRETITATGLEEVTRSIAMRRMRLQFQEINIDPRF